MGKIELVILVGVQASGKTTFYWQRLAGRYLHVSLDNWRGKDNVRGKEQVAIAQALAEAAGSGGRLAGVVVDNTNITVATRRRYFEYAAAFAAGWGLPMRMVAYYFDSDLAGCQARNQGRPDPKEAPTGTPYYVPPAAIANFYHKLQPPTHAEGFEAIYRVKIAPDGEFSVEQTA
jgi:predicted kinase